MPPTCDLRSASVPSLTPPIDKPGALFSDTASCSPERLPSSTLVPAFSTAPPGDVGPVAGDPLTVYRVACPCTGTLFLTRNGGQVHAEWQDR